MTNEDEVREQIQEKGMTTQVGTCMTAIMLARLLDKLNEIQKDKD